MKIKLKTKYNVNQKVVVRGIPHEGYYALGLITEIHFHVDKFGRTDHSYQVYVSGWGTITVNRETDMETLKEFDDRQKEHKLSYKNYVNWVNEQSFVKVEK